MAKTEPSPESSEDGLSESILLWNLPFEEETCLKAEYEIPSSGKAGYNLGITSSNIRQ